MPDPIKEQVDFIAAATGIWKAIGELAQVESKHSSAGLPVAAHGHMLDMEKTLANELDHWNNGGWEGPKITYCKEAQNGYCPGLPSITCHEPFFVGACEYCPGCSKARAGAAG